MQDLSRQNINSFSIIKLVKLYNLLKFYVMLIVKFALRNKKYTWAPIVTFLLSLGVNLILKKTIKLLNSKKVQVANPSEVRLIDVLTLTLGTRLWIHQ